MIDIIIPTFGRPSALASIVDNIRAVTRDPHQITFVAESHDPDTIAAVEQLGLVPVVNTRTANYAGALNTGWLQSTADWLFTGADDLIWHVGWHDAIGRLPRLCTVLGTNDLLNSAVAAGFHSTHSIVARSYLEEFGGVADEGPGSFYPECYDHNFCDTEFINTAKMRGRFRPCLDAVVEHLHVTTGKVEADETYLRSIRNYDADARMYDMRISVWSGISR
jgi:glycosyltransferase involved in cell wall biosynthesis